MDDLKDSHCSDEFIFDFKNRHRLSSRKFHTKRRPDVSYEYEMKFIKKIKENRPPLPAGRILNCNETGWNLIPRVILILSENSVDDNVRKSNTIEKGQITVFAIRALDRAKFPFYCKRPNGLCGMRSNLPL